MDLFSEVMNDVFDELKQMGRLCDLQARRQTVSLDPLYINRVARRMNQTLDESPNDAFGMPLDLSTNLGEAVDIGCYWVNCSSFIMFIPH